MKGEGRRRHTHKGERGRLTVPRKFIVKVTKKPHSYIFMGYVWSCHECAIISWCVVNIEHK